MASNFIFRSIVVRALKEFSGPNVMDQIYISYLDLMDPTSRRKEHLEKHYYFSCQVNKLQYKMR